MFLNKFNCTKFCVSYFKAKFCLSPKFLNYLGEIVFKNPNCKLIFNTKLTKKHPVNFESLKLITRYLVPRKLPKYICI